MTSAIRNRQTIKRIVKSQLAFHGLRQQDLAAALKIALATLSNKLTGKIRFSADELSTMTDLFNVSTDALLGREPMEVAQ
ncbi:XRE family transcriptional regulator [Bifidobacterium sp. ESL0763]|uniref:helix-turn-helix domain-containing protein n=1 Tax=Bifidobacterium sp. ESL0763 TaxID=2983227 RepID=UPI0023F66196|nr:helix-turn-helix domain-containing protein [Bifidobacterium sp. ESL0763]MDF7663312.1 XRE family transcriptional regulator [Bifidobacterium sp. ESL0763]